MKIKAVNQTFQAKLKLPIKIVTYYENGQQRSKKVNWVRVFTEPNAEIYYKKLLKARMANNTAEAEYWKDKMGPFKIIDLDKANPATILDILG